MTNIFFVSDTHFGHTNTWKLFKQPDGVTPLRPFTSTEEMDQTMIDNWNKVVKVSDHVYHLGDVVINKKFLETIKQLNGYKRLVRGNHDQFEDKAYRIAGFAKIYGVRVFDHMVVSHIPLHPNCITKRYNINVHGHLHSNVLNDPRYLCVSVEHTNYTPLHYDEVLQRIKINKDTFEKTGQVVHWQTGKLFRDVYGNSKYKDEVDCD